MTTSSWPEVGIFTYDFDTLPALIHVCQHHGLTAVQLGGPLLEKALADLAFAIEMRKLLDAHGIGIIALAGYRNLVEANAAKRASNLTFLKECLRRAPLLGTSIVATETGTVSEDGDWAASPANQSTAVRERFHAALGELLAVASHHGSILALEGFVNHVVNTPDAMSETLGQFATPQVQVILDPFNYLSRDLLPQSEQVINAFLDRFEQRFVLAHLKDVSAEGAEVGTPEFGSGVFPYQPYLRFLKHRRPDLPLILEHLPMEHLPMALARLRESLQSLTEIGLNHPFPEKEGT
jgi:sugar phosphate isomerase/epimerase